MIKLAAIAIAATLFASSTDAQYFNQFGVARRLAEPAAPAAGPV